MAWLGQIDAGSPFLLGVALPMVLIGAGMGATLALLTISGVAGVAPENAGSASGLVGVAHQLGGALGLAILVVAFATPGVPPGTAAHIELAHRIGVALSGAAALLAIALLLVLAYVVRRPILTKTALRV
jgi:hypothetical protein